MISLPTSQTRRAVGIVDEIQHARVDQQAAVAVLRQRGQRVAVDDRVHRPIRTARTANRRATATACGTAPSLRWDRCRPRGGWRHDVAVDAHRRRRRVPASRARSGRSHRATARRIAGAESVRSRRAADRTARRDATISPKRSGRVSSTSPSRRSSAARPSRPTSGLSALTWNQRAERRGIDVGQRRGVDAHGSPGDAEERAGEKRARARDAEAFRARGNRRSFPARDSATADPAPASSSTLITARSRCARNRSASAPCLQARGRARPCGRRRPPRNAASGCDTECRGRG